MIAMTIAVMAHGLLFANIWSDQMGKNQPQEHIDVLPIALNLAQQEQPESTPAEQPAQAQPVTPPPQAKPRPVKPEPSPSPKPRVQKTEPLPPVNEPAVEATARTETPPSRPQPTQQASASRQAMELRYLEELREAIMLHRQYPSRARRKHQEGTATIAFILRKDGRIEQTHIEGSSGYKTLDSAALRAVVKLGKFDPIPQELQRDDWPLSVSLQFTLR
jgi:protein TonB